MDQTQLTRPIPTTDDILDRGAGAQSGYIDSSYSDAVRNYGHYEVERVRAMRRPFGDRRALAAFTHTFGGLLENPIVSGLLSPAIGDFTFSPGQNNIVHHSFLDLVLRDPSSGSRKLLRIEKAPTVRAHEMGGEGGNVDQGRWEEARVALMMQPNDMSGALSFREFSRRAIETDAAANSGDKTAIGRYSIANKNCQHFSVSALKGAGLLTQPLHDFTEEYNTGKLPKWLQAKIDHIAMTSTH